jgi:predicted amidophosphoribosyltransferase
MNCKTCGQPLTANTLDCCPRCFPRGNRPPWSRLWFELLLVWPLRILFSYEALIVLLIVAAVAIGIMQFWKE